MDVHPPKYSKIGFDTSPYASIHHGSTVQALLSSGEHRFHQWIGLRDNLQESPIFNGKIYGFRLKFSLKPIH